MIRRSDKKNINVTVRNVGWSIGSYCNAHCAHCYSRDARRDGDLLTQEDILIVLDKLQKLGVRTLNLGGNEPIFTHSLQTHDSILPFLIREVRRRNITIGITTNGTTLLLLYKAFPKEFEMVNDWDISLDSPFKQEHDRNRGNGFYDIAMKALELARNNGCSCSIVYCLMNFNCLDEHAKALAKLTRNFHVDLRINTLKPTREELLNLEASTNQIQKFFCNLSKNYMIKHNSDISTVISSEESLIHCPCGKQSFAISPKKNNVIHITPCVYLQKYGVGNLLTEDILTIFETPIFQVFRNHKAKKCHLCAEIHECGGGCLAYILLSSQYGKCDNRCPVLHGYITDLKIKHYEENRKPHVHEDYLCTWIGENK